MIHLTMTPTMSTIRVYDKPNGYDERRPYLGLVTVIHLTDKTAYVCGAVGKIDRATRATAFSMLRDLGITKLMYERRGKMKTTELQ
jgi:hypothetical protein